MKERAPLCAVICILLCGMSGCAALNKADCEGGDWSRIGYQDGLQGVEVERLAKHRKSCDTFSVEVDAQAYLKAHAAGLREHCQPENGFKKGDEGRDHRVSCPTDLEPQYLKRYISGLERALERVEQESGDNQSRVDAAQLEKHRAQLAASQRAFDSQVDYLSNRGDALVYERNKIREWIVTWSRKLEPDNAAAMSN